MEDREDEDRAEADELVSSSAGCCHEWSVVEKKRGDSRERFEGI
jgi:hypothetical protein